MSQVTDKPKRGYWYRFTFYECPVCGHEDSIKERVYDKPKPENPYNFEYLADCYCWLYG